MGVLFPKPCGRFTTAPVPLIEYECYGLKITSPFAIGGSTIFCCGIYNWIHKRPSFYCVSSTDCISGCGFRAGNGGCIAVNRKDKDYLQNNKLDVENRFPLLCYRNTCTFKVGEMIIGFRITRSGEISPYDMLEPETFEMVGWFWCFLKILKE
jgi:hypothetical protein